MLFLISLLIGLILGCLIGGVVLLMARSITPSLHTGDALELEPRKQTTPSWI
ncbi:hypothetical protein [Deinococcus cellulosilyticus]|uniref:Uncharacterized protein n=1 Tax=Deinococcus cellulosilyticus (strain DSM 18568 / NBRC 106333 / KACC 11606 / 5516J-15) TaxID=1223518 RepID=A0A511MZA8_DEIC1|nr:hypothetical protein [Deinococcus cellulosilyticus]GEM45487.1 hypothetical protein DC3_11220 [Deinococcus cellulosilyticus NBRC 106333 = KACC 11606]